MPALSHDFACLASMVLLALIRRATCPTFATAQDAWNAALVSSCDAVAVFPATSGRVREAYCTEDGERGGKVSLRSSDKRQKEFEAVEATLMSQPQLLPPLQRERTAQCETMDARLLAGPAQFMDQDTWFGDLEGLRVLVIHPFASTMARQYHRHRAATRNPNCNTAATGNSAAFQTAVGRENSGDSCHGLLFPGNPRALPEFKELLTYKPALGNSKGQGWRSGLEIMKQELRVIALGAVTDGIGGKSREDVEKSNSSTVGDGHALSFDVALLSCGAWAPLLQDFLRRELRVSSVYVGGALQLHFGVWGKRWEGDRSFVERFGGTHEWAWPSVEESSALRKHVKGAAAAGGYTGTAAQEEEMGTGA